MDNIHKCIYMLISPSKKCYIGKTVNLKRRFRKHRRARGDKILYNAIRKYGWDNFLKVIIEVFDDDVSKETMSEREIYWIAKHETLKPNGYNCTKGGEGMLGRKVPEETRKKLRAAAKAQWANPESRAKIMAATKTHQKGRPVSERTRAKLSAAQMGHKGYHVKEVTATCIESGTKRKFDTIKSAVDTLSQETGLNFDDSCISKCCKKKQKKHHGYTFNYVT